jgi:hypothetical protein
LAYKVLVSDSVQKLLEALAVGEPAEARDLALVLLSLGKNPHPQASRELRPTLIEPVPSERVWERPGWVITYRVNTVEQAVEVGKVGRR